MGRILVPYSSSLRPVSVGIQLCPFLVAFLPTMQAARSVTARPRALVASCAALFACDVLSTIILFTAEVILYVKLIRIANPRKATVIKIGIVQHLLMILFLTAFCPVWLHQLNLQHGTADSSFLWVISLVFIMALNLNEVFA